MGGKSAQFTQFTEEIPVINFAAYDTNDKFIIGFALSRANMLTLAAGGVVLTKIAPELPHGGTAMMFLQADNKQEVQQVLDQSKKMGDVEEIHAPIEDKGTVEF